MRLFVALEAPASWQAAARSVRQRMERALDRREVDHVAALRWVDPALLHLSLRFLGEVPQQRLAVLCAALDEALPPVTLDLDLGAVGTFGPAARTAVIWLAVAGDLAALTALAGRVDAAVIAAGCPPQQRPFRPHLTLARLRRRADERTRRAVAAEARALVGSPAAAAARTVPFRTGAVTLVRSRLDDGSSGGGAGPRYEALRRFGLPPGAEGADRARGGDGVEWMAGERS